ncbi:LEA type 2 family protein [Polyangium sp. 6x1]|uniref:LEA type 2 family protein n=1 Tax=Polyangium sp. 6x1 TaxID=3042689 RepID=UPI00248307D6|nr:LEA type 2 family protein [Polyangium sp. 6x1]MDI1442903.1 LEA type 2 family protein [Polyangium sp. 6x1]
MTKLLPPLLLVTALALGAAGCAAEKPTLRLHHAELRSASLRGVGLDVYLTVDNPNSFDIEIRNVRVTVTFAEKYALPTIDYSPNQWLAAGQSTVVRVPVAIPFTLVPGVIDEARRTPTLRYTVKGSADVTAVRALGVEKDNYPIDEAGALGREDLLAAAGISL